MRGNLRKWCVLGALASAAWVFPGCKSDSRDMAPEEGLDRSTVTTRTEELPGGATTIIMERDESGTGGSGSMQKATPPVRAGAGSDAGTMMDAGTGGSGFDPAAVPNAVPPNMH